MHSGFISDYLAEIGTVPAMSEAEDRECVREVCARGPNAQSAANRLIEANLSVVVAIATSHHQQTTVPLLKEGNLGLANAIHDLLTRESDVFAVLAARSAEQAILKAISMEP